MINVDVIVPVYNVERYLDECIESILKQTYSFFTLILVNDGSTDNSLSICKKWAKRDKRIRIIQKENGGLVSAWLAGLRESSNNWVIFIDSDDWIEKRHIETLVDNQNKTEADLIVTHMKQVGDAISKVIPFCVEEKCYKDKLLTEELYPVMLNAGGFEMRGIPFSRCSKLIRKDLLLNNIKYTSESTTYEEDMNIIFPTLLDASSISLVSGSNACYCYRRVENSMLHGYDKKMEQSIEHIYPALRRACMEKDKDFFLTQVNFEYVSAMVRSATNELQNPSGLRETKKYFERQSKNNELLNAIKNVDFRKYPMKFKIVIRCIIKYDILAEFLIIPILVACKRLKQRKAK